MENAGKALQIAGGILIAVILIGVIVLTYNSISDIKKSEYEKTEIEQSNDFNKSFDSYNRNGVYGSEIFSLANKIINYNLKRNYNIENGYSDINMSVTFKNTETIQDLFSVTSDQEGLINGYKSLSKQIDYAGKVKIEDYTVSYWYAKGGTSAIQREIANVRDMDDDAKKLNNYSQLISKQTDIARKVFNCTSVSHDTNGRITKMEFTEQ